MMQAKVPLGATGSSAETFLMSRGDPAVCKAGLAVTRGSDGALDLGARRALSLGLLGRSLSDIENARYFARAFACRFA